MRNEVFGSLAFEELCSNTGLEQNSSVDNSEAQPESAWADGGEHPQKPSRQDFGVWGMTVPKRRAEARSQVENALKQSRQRS